MEILIFPSNSIAIRQNLIKYTHIFIIVLLILLILCLDDNFRVLTIQTIQRFKDFQTQMLHIETQAMKVIQGFEDLPKKKIS